MRIIYADPNAPQPERRPQPEGSARRPIDCPALLLRLAIAHLDVLARDPAHPHRHQFHEGDGAALLALRERYEAGGWAGMLDRRGPADQPDTSPAQPQMEPASVLGYCLACGDELTTRADLCARCAGLTGLEDGE